MILVDIVPLLEDLGQVVADIDKIGPHSLWVVAGRHRNHLVPTAARTLINLLTDMGIGSNNVVCGF